MSNREETDPQDAALVRRRQALGTSVLWVTGVAALLTLMGPSLKNTVQVYFVPLATSLEVSGISAGHYLRSFGALAEQDAWEFGRSIGHTGVSDQLLGLADLISSRRLETGDRVLLVGAGNGLSAAGLLLEIC